MGKKNHGKAQKKKLTKKEQKQMNHLKLIKGGKSNNGPEFNNNNDQSEYKKSA